MKRAEGTASGMQKIDLKILKRMLKFMEDAGLAELDLEMEGVKVRLRKAGAESAAPVMHVPVHAVAPVAVPVPPAPPVPAGAPAAPPQPPTGLMPPPPAPAARPGSLVRSPMVGTFYRAPSPTSPPFVSAGDVVKEGQTLCLIEAMKLMNEIKAEKGGTVLKILVENGQPVEFDQPLFELDPAE